MPEGGIPKVRTHIFAVPIRYTADLHSALLQIDRVKQRRNVNSIYALPPVPKTSEEIVSEREALEAEKAKAGAGYVIQNIGGQDVLMLGEPKSKGRSDSRRR